jgi:hypothetical protein
VTPVEWTRKIPAAEREFIADVLDRYQRLVGSAADAAYFTYQ